MSLSYYQLTVPVFQRALGNLDGILDKVLEHCEQNKIDPDYLFNFRLYPDMFPMRMQVQIVTDFSIKAVKRLAGQEVVEIPFEEKNFAELKQRIAAAQECVGAMKPEHFAESASIQLSIPTPYGPLSFDAEGYLTTFVYPNFYFHMTTAYNIARHNGVPLGKFDFTGKYTD